METTPGEGCDAAEVQPVRRVEQAVVVYVVAVGDGQEREDPATIVVDKDDRQVQPQAAGGQQSTQVVEEGQVTGEQDGRFG